MIIILLSRGFEEDVNDKFSKTRGHIASEFAEVSVSILKDL